MTLGKINIGELQRQLRDNKFLEAVRSFADTYMDPQLRKIHNNYNISDWYRFKDNVGRFKNRFSEETNKFRIHYSDGEEFVGPVSHYEYDDVGKNCNIHEVMGIIKVNSHGFFRNPKFEKIIVSQLSSSFMEPIESSSIEAIERAEENFNPEEYDLPSEVQGFKLRYMVPLKTTIFIC